MAILADMKSFYRWLDESSDDELKTRRDAALSAIRGGQITTDSVVREARRLIRRIEEEMVSRKLTT
jgi:hypothetical protein